MNRPGKHTEPSSPSTPRSKQRGRNVGIRLPKILMVDDRRENLVALRQVLDEVDAELIEAATGNQALAATLDYEFALAILDVQMPGMDGYELAELLRGDPRTWHVPIIFLTAAYGQEQQVFRGYEAGAVDYIVKPYHPPMLRSKVNIFLELNRKTDDLSRQAEALCQSEEQLRQVAADLSEADRRKDEFLAMLAHELRNPLAALAGALQLLEAPEATTEELHTARAVAGRQVSQLQRLIDDLLDISRITRGKVEMRNERFDLVRIAEQAVEMVRSLFESHGHQLRVSLQQDRELMVDGDPARIEQVVVNLLTNAAKYTQQGGQITLTVRRDGDHHLVCVRDTGIGIPADVLPSIFDLFAQAPRSLARNEGGLGIGLTLVKALVELHDGTIGVQSKEGEGSEFIVSLPRAASPNPSQASEPQATPDVPSRRVLVVDDNQDSARMLGMLLKISGHVVELAHDGEDAIRTTGTFAPDVVLLDVGLPGLNGYEVAERIRQNESLSQPLIIGVSGYGQSKDRRRAQAAGMDEYLVKPVNPTELHALLAKAGD